MSRMRVPGVAFKPAVGRDHVYARRLEGEFSGEQELPVIITACGQGREPSVKTDHTLAGIDFRTSTKKKQYLRRVFSRAHGQGSACDDMREGFSQISAYP